MSIHRNARFVFLLIAIVAGSMGLARQASSFWTADGVTIKATSASIPKITACSDGVSGSFVVWNEGTPTGRGVLRAQHVLSTGDLDPLWPAAGAVVCADSAIRGEMGALPDRSGGLYVWWLTNGSLSLKRIDAAGATPAGWPDAGRLLGAVNPLSPSPSVIEDGAHGIYLAWSESAYGRLYAIHLGPDNTGAGGWSNSPRGIGPGIDGTTLVFWPQLAPAPDGGVFVAWGLFSMDTTLAAAEWKLRRITSAGSNATDWPAEGLSLGEFHPEWLGYTWTSANLALSPDGRGGVFLMKGDAEYCGDPGCLPASVTERLLRLQGDGQPAADWPAAGVIIEPLSSHSYWAGGPDLSYGLFPDQVDGAFAGSVDYSEHPSFVFQHFGPSGSEIAGGAAGSPLGHEASARVGGGLYFAEFHPDGPYNRWDSYAFLGMSEWSALTSWWMNLEWHDDPLIVWYGDIGLAATEDGGAVFYWSQVHERSGLFARRFSATGEATAVEPPTVATIVDLRALRFVPGAGIRLLVSVPGFSAARIDVFDVSGRRIATDRLGPSETTREVTISGTAGLRPGLYFARLAAGGKAISRRVIVVR